MDSTLISRRDLLKYSAWTAALAAVPAWAAGLDEERPAEYMTFNSNTYAGQWTVPADLAATDPAVVALNRVAFGPRPGDVERVRVLGVDNYIEAQLSPGSVDDSALESLLTRFPTLTMSVSALAQNYVEAIQQRRLQKLEESQGSVTDVPTAVQGFLGLFGADPNQPGAAMSPAPIGPAQTVTELAQATVLRQIFSERQLNEMMVDFWSNHFNIYILKNQDTYLKTVDDRDVIRKYALDKFSDLLHASAHSPAMLVYLDNVTNVKGVANENYARELMELHTLSVDGGYTQTDVQEVARCFTGWSVNAPRRGLLGMEYDQAGEFTFRPNLHDDGDKQVLGLRIPAGGGIQDGEQVLDLLAHHPKTAEFISTKLVRRFVADAPPAALVARAADTFNQTGGDIRAVMSVILHSDEFKQSFGQKAKRPLEFVASAVRALQGQPAPAPQVSGSSGGSRPGAAGQAIAQALRLMGQVPFMWQSPNGYPDLAAAWINSNNLLARWNLALALAQDRAPGLNIDLNGAASGAGLTQPEAIVDWWIDRLLHRTIPDADRNTLIGYLGGETSPDKVANLVALILASPHFQYR